MSATQEDVQELVYGAIESFGTSREIIDRDSTLESLDVDSLDLVELGQLVEEKYNLRLTSDDLSEVQTVGQAVDLILEKLQ